MPTLGGAPVEECSFYNVYTPRLSKDKLSMRRLFSSSSTLFSKPDAPFGIFALRCAFYCRVWRVINFKRIHPCVLIASNRTVKLGGVVSITRRFSEPRARPQTAQNANRDALFVFVERAAERNFAALTTPASRILIYC